MILGGWEVDGTDSGSCPMVGFGISGAESSGSATTVLVRPFLNHPLLPCGVKGFLLVNLLDTW